MLKKILSFLYLLTLHYHCQKLMRRKNFVLAVFDVFELRLRFTLFSEFIFRIEIISEDEKSYHDTLNATLGGVIS